MDKNEKHELLPIIDVKNDSFSSLDQDKSKSKIMSLINRHIIFELWDKGNHTIQQMPGKLLEYNDDYLLIKPYDYNNESNLFDEFEKVYIDKIRGIERYRKYNQHLKLTDKYKNSICEITDRENKTITVLVNDFDNFEIEFEFKYKDEKGVRIGVGTYPICLVKEINAINN